MVAAWCAPNREEVPAGRVPARARRACPPDFGHGIDSRSSARSSGTATV